jgi:hypothetical protein
MCGAHVLPSVCACPKRKLENWPQTWVCGQVRSGALREAMSLEFIAAGIIGCLFALIALMPPFDGKWES